MECTMLEKLDLSGTKITSLPVGLYHALHTHTVQCHVPCTSTMRAQSFQIRRPSRRHGRSGGSGRSMCESSAALGGGWNAKTGVEGLGAALFALLGAATRRAGIALALCGRASIEQR